MPRYQKRPVIIEAEQWNATAPPRHTVDIPHPHVRSTSYGEIAKLLGTSGCSKTPPYWSATVLGIVETLEGPHVIEPGDYLITGIKGEHYPCKPDIFEASYELVQEGDAA